MRIIGIIEARTGSSRLPNKVLKKILGKPMLELLIERIRKSKNIDEIIIATSINPNDDPIENLAKKINVNVYRGSEDDVLDRVLQSAITYHADYIVELWGDCPLIDYEVIDNLIKYYKNNNYDLVGTCLNKTYPWGISSLIFPRKILEEVSRNTNDYVDRENVSNYIYEHPEKYKIGYLPCSPEIRRPEIRLCVDEINDFKLIKLIFENLYHINPDFKIIDIINFIESNPNIKNINKNVVQKKLR